MKKVMISQSNYIPWKGYFDSINSVDEFVILDDVQYTKRDWRSRNKIKTPNGLQWLTVPVLTKGRREQLIEEAVVENNSWARKHWGAIQQSYSKAPHYNDFKERFEQLYEGLDTLFLSEINYAFICAINEILGIDTKVTWSHDYHPEGKRGDRILDICKKTQATDYFSGPAAKSYMDEEMFGQNGINVHYFDYSGYPEYEQLYGDFAHEVSILDLLFHNGNKSTSYLKSFNT